MSVETEIQRYWELATKYHRAFTPAGKIYVASIEISNLYLRAENEKVLMHCSNIMSQEGISHDEEGESLNPSA